MDNNNSQGQAPIGPQQEGGAPETSHSSIGPVLASVIVIILLIVAAMYMLLANQEATEKLNGQDLESASGTTEEETNIPTSTSTDISSIEEDLDNTNTSDFDSTYAEIEAELDAESSY